MNKHRTQGFTLIELMVVVSIIGILAAVALPNYTQYSTRAQIADGLALADELKIAIKDYYKHTGRMPKDNAAAGLPPAEKLLGNYVKGIRVENGAMHIQFGNRAHASINGKILTVRPLVVQGSPMSPMSWLCGHAEAPDGMHAEGETRTDVLPAVLPYPCRSYR